MHHVDMTAALAYGHCAARALADGIAHADGGPSLQRTLSLPARDRTGAAYFVEVVLRVERIDDG